MTTREEMLRKWDAGEPVSTIEMGGLGPGYEQAIQVLVMEILRDYSEAPALKAAEESEEAARLRWRGWGEAAVTRCDRMVGGFSGAQVGAAKSLASAFLRKGIDACFGEVEADRRILVSRAFPQAPAPTPKEDSR